MCQNHSCVRLSAFAVRNTFHWSGGRRMCMKMQIDWRQVLIQTNINFIPGFITTVLMCSFSPENVVTGPRYEDMNVNTRTRAIPKKSTIRFSLFLVAPAGIHSMPFNKFAEHGICFKGTHTRPLSLPQLNCPISLNARNESSAFER